MTTDDQDLWNYSLIRDRSKRVAKSVMRYRYAEIIAFTFSVAQEILKIKPISYKECMTCKDAKK